MVENGGGKKRNRNRNKNKNKGNNAEAAPAEAEAAPAPAAAPAAAPAEEPKPAAQPAKAQSAKKKSPSPPKEVKKANNGGANVVDNRSPEEKQADLIKNLAMDFPPYLSNFVELRAAEARFHAGVTGNVANGNGDKGSDSDIDLFGSDDDDVPKTKPKLVKPAPKAAPKAKQDKKQGKKKAAVSVSDDVNEVGYQNPANGERSFVMLKPDAVQRNLIGEIMNRFEARGFKPVAVKFMQASESLLKKHYADLSKKPFFPDLVSYMASGPVVPMIWEGLNAVKTIRTMLGETNPQNSKPGSIRGDYCIDVGRNIIHASDSVEAAQKEIGLWFGEQEICKWRSHEIEWVYEDEETEEKNPLRPTHNVDNLSALAGNSDLAKKVKKLEDENKSLKKVCDDLKKLVLTLEGRVGSLEKGGASSSAPAAADDDDDDDDVDLFGSDEDEEEDAEKVRIREERLKAYHEKKSKKPALIAKTSVLLDVKPWDDETDMDAMLAACKSITKEGLVWGASKLVPVGYGIQKLQVMCVVEDEKVSIDELSEQITGFEDFVQSVDIAAMSKI